MIVALSLHTDKNDQNRKPIDKYKLCRDLGPEKTTRVQLKYRDVYTQE